MAGSFLRQSTASQSRATHPFLDDTDFKTEETGLTIANTDVKLIVNGGASADKNSGGGTHRANGVYGLTFDATDTATVGEMEVSIKVAGALPVFMKFWVLEEAVYDALFGAAAPGYQVPIWAAENSTVNLSGTTVKAVTDGVTVTTNNDKTGYSLTQAFPTNFAALGINVSGDIDRVTLVDNLTNYIGDSPQSGDAYSALLALYSQIIPQSGTVIDATPTASAFDTSLTVADDFWNDARVQFTSGALTGQSRIVTDFANASGAMSFDEPWTSEPATGDAFIIVADHVHAIAQIQAGLATAAAVDDLPTNAELAARTLLAAEYATQATSLSIKGQTDRLRFNGDLTGEMLEVDVHLYGGATGAFSAGRPEVNVARWQGGTPSALDGGRVDTSVGSMQANVFTASALAADAVAEIQSGLALAGSAMTLSAAGLDSVIIEGGIVASAALTNDTGTQLTSINARQALSAVLSACAAVFDGAGTTNGTFKPAAKPAGNTRIDATTTLAGKSDGRQLEGSRLDVPTNLLASELLGNELLGKGRRRSGAACGGASVEEGDRRFELGAMPSVTIGLAESDPGR